MGAAARGDLVTESLATWLGAGTHAHLREAGGARRGSVFEIFHRELGQGPWLTLLHGFPSSSWDWAAVAPELATRHRLLAFDFLGFGDSSKPRRHDYSLFEQADVTESLWQRCGVAETGLVAHDYGSSVALELLARQAAGSLRTRITGVVLMNAGLYLDLYRPLRIQKLLRRPLIGPLLSLFLSERAFRRNFRAVFAPGRAPSDDELRQHWQAIARRGGARVYHRLIRYIDERHRYRWRWETALEGAGLPMGFVWGALDPVSGAPILARLRERLPAASFLELPDVGHYPQLEAPAAAAAEVLRFFAGRAGGVS